MVNYVIYPQSFFLTAISVMIYFRVDTIRHSPTFFLIPTQTTCSLFIPALVPIMSSPTSNESNSHEASRPSVIIETLGPLVLSDDPDKVKEWPSGEFLLTSMLPKYQEFLPSADPSYWQQNARRALLEKYGLYDKEKVVTGEDQLKVISNLWDKFVDNIFTSPEATSSTTENDLAQLLRSNGLSNDRKLEWALMDCVPGCQFRLHAHPNVELVYCVKGELHEIRMNGDPWTKSFQKHRKDTSQVIGPSLLDCQRPWRFGTLKAGEWLVNEIGSIHKSFTATNGEGCVLLCLWGGSHANISEEPSLVVNALNRMDQKLTSQCGCHPSTAELEAISETFLPDSEKSKTGK